MRLTITNGSASNPLTLDLTQYIRVSQGDGMDPANPNFREAVISHSLLKEGGTLALENLREKELVFPLRLKATTSSALAILVQQVNQVMTSAGALASWQDDGMTQPTYFDLITGQFDVEYNYREGQNHFCSGKLRLFSQPLGHTAGPRAYAAASGVGPLLMISPYASSGALAIGASTQAGAAGFGGAPAGASSGIFYPGSPSLAGDAGALLQISYAGPLPVGATLAGAVPYAAVSLLPDALYQPLITITDATLTLSGASVINSSNGVAGKYVTVPQPNARNWAELSFLPVPTQSFGLEPTANWAGVHRLFAIARASQSSGYLYTLANSIIQTQTVATINPGSYDWQLYDLGTFAIRPSEIPTSGIQVIAQGAPGVGASGATGAAEIAALVMLPDASTWFFNPTTINPNNYGFPAAASPLSGNALVATAPYTNTLLLDDVLGDQFIYTGQSQTFAPSPIGSVPSSVRVTPYTRGLIPRPDPKNGLPIICILGVAQSSTPSALNVVPLAGASWPNPQNLRTMAQVSVLERTRYVFG